MQPGPQNQTNRDPVTAGLADLLTQHSDKRVIVVGTTCTGKSTLLARIDGARDQDREVFPTLSAEESAYVCQEPWTPEIGAVMTGFVRDRVQSRAGSPVFGTVLIDCDLIVLLKISDDLLRERTTKRDVSFLDAKNMQMQLEEQVRTSGIPYIQYPLG